MRTSSLLGTLLATTLMLGAGIAHAEEGAAPEAAPEAPAAEAASPSPEAAPGAEAVPEAAPAEPAPVEPAPPIAPVAPAVAPAPVRTSSAPPGADIPAAKVANDEDGPLGPFRLGALAGTGAPSVVSAELVLKYKGWVGLAADFGRLPSTKVPIGSDVKVAQTHLSAAMRVYPFHGAFFVGAALGTQQITGTAVEQAYGQKGSISMTSRTVFVMPQIGFLYRFSFGLAIGSDIGVELPLIASSSIGATAAGTSVDAPESVQNVVRFVQKNPIPVLNLLRVGFVL